MKEVLLMDPILILRIIIFIMFCLVGFQIGNWLSPSKEIKNVDLPKKSVIEECKDGICPTPKDWKVKK
jgi:hypothetical protein